MFFALDMEKSSLASITHIRAIRKSFLIGSLARAANGTLVDD